nr:hypothetical protein [Nostoc sp. ChiSLP03a]
MQPPLRPERAHDYSSAKYPQLDNPQLGLLAAWYFFNDPLTIAISQA